MPAEWQPILWNQPFLNVDSWVEHAAVRRSGSPGPGADRHRHEGRSAWHTPVYARTMLGPNPRRISKLEGLSTAGAIDWSNEWPPNTQMNYGPVAR